jgi:hypothetical protein
VSYRNFAPPADRTVKLSEAAWCVSCPTCQAWQGFACTSLDGVSVVKPHAKRMQYAESIVRAAEGQA